MPKPGTHDAVYIALKELKFAHNATFSHSIETANIAAKISTTISRDLALEPKDIRNAALFHDIGKLFVPVDILEKNGKLTLQERECVVPHPIWGEQVLLTSSDPRIRN